MMGRIFGERRRLFSELGAAAGAAFLIAVTLGWRAGHAAQPPAFAAEVEQWSIPPARKEDAARDLAILAVRKPWTGFDTLGSAKAGAAAAPTWRFAGSVLRGTERFALIVTAKEKDKGREKDAQANKLLYVKVGDQLPDGSSVLEITLDTLVSDGGQGSPGEKHSYQMFAGKKP